jgi:hypothetical protein
MKRDDYIDRLISIVGLGFALVALVVAIMKRVGKL